MMDCEYRLAAIVHYTVLFYMDMFSFTKKGDIGRQYLNTSMECPFYV